MLLTFAFSARNFIKDVGSYAGFASVIALALFALLLFAQAREIKRLREWGSQAHDRIGELERSVAAALDMARRAVARPAAPAQAPAQPARGIASRRAVGPAGAAAAAGSAAAARVASTSAPVRPQLLPAAPVGLAGPPLASATVLIPLPGAPSSTAEPSVPMRAATPAGRPAVGLGGATTAAAAIDQRERVVPDNGSNGYHDDPPTEVPPPLRATPAPAPASARPAAGGPPRRPAGPAGARPRPGGRPQPAGAARGGNGARGGSQEPQEAPHGRRRFGAVLLVILALVVVGGAAFLLLGGRDDATRDPVRVETPSGATRTRRAAARRQATTRAATPAPPHGDTSVAVLNGTGLTGLAGRVMTELTSAGYPAGPVGDASSSNRPSTAVSFRPGAEAAAREVARTLGISTDAVTEIDTDTESAACRYQDPCTAQVVVTVGADHSQ